jgi:hypothetical protein
VKKVDDAVRSERDANVNNLGLKENCPATADIYLFEDPGVGSGDRGEKIRGKQAGRSG